MASPSSSPEPLPFESKQSPLKKSHPIPWSHQETLALIQAYQQKWYSLNKGQLKAFQWEEVAATVAALCSSGFNQTNKTSTQCRHKIEKLRKRYRSEMKKPYPNTWQYFDPMDIMERGQGNGKLTINARPIAIVDSSTNNGNSNVNQSYGSLYSDYYSRSRSDESDDEWNVSNKKKKSKSINNILRNQVNVNGKRKQYYDVNDTDDDDEVENGVEEEEMGFAAEIRGFTENFMRIEGQKIEMMRETQRYRMEMEKKRIEMIVEAQTKIVDTIGRAIENHNKEKFEQET